MRVLYAGRLTPEKGIYTLLEMIHGDLVADRLHPDARVTVTVTTAGADKPHGRMLRRMLTDHPACGSSRVHDVGVDGRLMAAHDVVVMPSNSQYWHETFGIVSIEAQHAGCRVVASDDGGLPETDCGAITLVAPDDAVALAHGIGVAVGRGAVPAAQRRAAARRFTVERSVDALLEVLTDDVAVDVPRPADPPAHPVPDLLGPARGAPMNDKSPRQNLSKKSAKSLKEKREEKRAKRDGADDTIPTTSRKRRNGA